MQIPESYRLFLRRGPRGIAIFGTLRVLAVAASSLALALSVYRVWAIAGFLAAGLFTVALHHVRAWYASALKVNQNPHVVYWAHPTTARQHFSSESIDVCRLLTLHLRDGTQFEVGAQMTPAGLREFINWLKEQNPSIRWGAYDDTTLASAGAGGSG